MGVLKKDSTRRFRIKFATTPSQSCTASCLDFVSKMSLHFDVKSIPVTEGESQIPMEDSQILTSSQQGSASVDITGTGMALSDVARKVIPAFILKNQKKKENIKSYV